MNIIYLRLVWGRFLFAYKSYVSISTIIFSSISICDSEISSACVFVYRFYRAICVYSSLFRCGHHMVVYSFHSYKYNVPIEMVKTLNQLEQQNSKKKAIDTRNSAGVNDISKSVLLYSFCLQIIIYSSFSVLSLFFEWIVNSELTEETACGGNDKGKPILSIIMVDSDNGTKIKC